MMLVRPPRPFELVERAHAREEVEIARAAAHGNVLAVVEGFAGAHVDEGGGAPAEFLAGFDERDGDAALAQAERAGDAGGGEGDRQRGARTPDQAPDIMGGRRSSVMRRWRGGR